MPVLAARRRGGGLSSYASELKLLLDFEGADGSSTFTDLSDSAHSIASIYGTPTISTGWAGSGSSSLLLNAREGFTIADSADFAFGSNPFAVGIRFRITSDSTYDWLIGQRNANLTTTPYWSVIVLSSGALEIRFTLSDGSTIQLDGGVVSVSTDHNLIVSRDSDGKFRAHLDGSLIDSETSALAVGDSTFDLSIGYSGTGSLDPQFRGYQDSIFILNGVNPFSTDDDVTFPDPDDFSASPTITGNPSVTTDSGFHGEGDTATATAAPYTGIGLLEWQWLRDGVAISGATSESYTYTASDVGTDVRVRQRISASNGTATALSTAQTIVTPTYQTDTRIAGADTRIAGADTRTIQTRIA